MITSCMECTDSVIVDHQLHHASNFALKEYKIKKWKFKCEVLDFFYIFVQLYKDS